MVSKWEQCRHAVKAYNIAEGIIHENRARPGTVRQILEKVAQEIPEGAELTLDVTQGMRHFPFIFYALVLYLTSLWGVKVRGAYYGMIEGTSQDAPRPIIDLQPLLALPEWFHAVRVFRDQGTTSAMAQLLEPLAEKLKQETGAQFKAGDKNAGQKSSAQLKQVKDVVDFLEKHAFAYESALPLELGKASLHLIDPIKKIADMDTSSLPPLFAELTDTIAGVAEKAAFANPIPRKGEWKQNIPLDENELNRQARMIDLYLDRDQLPLAVGLMREWVVHRGKRSCAYQFDLRLSLRHGFSRNPEGFKSSVCMSDGNLYAERLTPRCSSLLVHHAGIKPAPGLVKAFCTPEV